MFIKLWFKRRKTKLYLEILDLADQRAKAPHRKVLNLAILVLQQFQQHPDDLETFLMMLWLKTKKFTFLSLSSSNLMLSF